MKRSGTTGLLARAGETAYLLALNQLEQSVPWWPVGWTERLQRFRIRSVMEHAYAQVPFYRRTLDELGAVPRDFASARDLERLPLIDGSQLGASPDDFTAAAYRHANREVFNTSGSSSGVRKQICWDRPSLMRRFARAERDRSVILHLAGERRIANMLREVITTERQQTLASHLLGIDSVKHQRLHILPAGFSNRTRRTLGEERSLLPRRPLHYHHLSPTAPFEAAVAKIRTIEPRLVFSFGSYAEHFLRHVADRRVDVPLPRVWLYVGDMISAAGRELADELGCCLYSVYGAAETGTIGFQCERREGFHVNVDLCALRVVDGSGRTLPPGQVSDIVVSALDNRATVLLNYRIGDRGVLDDRPCPCGRSLPLLARFEGRRSEMIELPDGRTLSSAVLEGMFRAELRRTLRAQIEQLAPGRLQWRIMPFRSADPDELRRAFVLRAEQVLGPGVALTVEFANEIATTSEGKLIRALIRQETGGRHTDQAPAVGRSGEA